MYFVYFKYRSRKIQLHQEIIERTSREMEIARRRGNLCWWFSSVRYDAERGEFGETTYIRSLFGSRSLYVQHVQCIWRSDTGLMDRRERSELLGERKKTSLDVAYPTRVSSTTSLHLFAVSRVAKIHDIHHHVGKLRKKRTAKLVHLPTVSDIAYLCTIK